ncbi:hypothetical protein HK105_208608 [Polyrhizophydium stewartii]|uniref:Paired amphipathic helix protein Sin3a n=1 Tax=Polyrhizophydium stewartii TaxID=2732419 RepID=A0ABR4MX99_9FUNG
MNQGGPSGAAPATTASGTSGARAAPDAVPDAAPGAAGEQQPSPQQEPQQPKSIHRALDFLDAVKATATQAEFVEFLGLLRQFKAGQIAADSLHNQVTALLGAYPDLLQDFAEFLPPVPSPPSPVAPPIEAAAAAAAAARPPHDAAQAARVHILHGHELLPSRRSASSATPVASTPTATPTQATARPPRSVRSQASAASTTTTARAAAATDAATRMLSSGAGAGGEPAMSFSQAIDFIHVVRAESAGNPKLYTDFLELLRSSHQGMQPLSKLIDDVRVLFADKPDLLRRFLEFLPQPAAEGTQSAMPETESDDHAGEDEYDNDEGVRDGHMHVQGRGGLGEPLAPAPIHAHAPLPTLAEEVSEADDGAEADIEDADERSMPRGDSSATLLGHDAAGDERDAREGRPPHPGRKPLLRSNGVYGFFGRTGQAKANGVGDAERQPLIPPSQAYATFGSPPLGAGDAGAAPGLVVTAATPSLGERSSVSGSVRADVESNTGDAVREARLRKRVTSTMVLAIVGWLLVVSVIGYLVLEHLL